LVNADLKHPKAFGLSESNAAGHATVPFVVHISEHSLQRAAIPQASRLWRHKASSLLQFPFKAANHSAECNTFSSS
jgi:hypothetical protein